MNLAHVMDEIAAAMKEISGLTVHAYPIANLTAPAGYLSYPASIDYDAAYADGEDGFTDLPIVLVSGKANDKAARDKVARWTARGPDSLKKALEGRRWVSCDNVEITGAEFDVEMIGGVPYLAAMFKATVIGTGEE